MKIKIDKVKGGFRADFIELPGSPVVGTGVTVEEAVATLFIRNIDNVSRLDLTYLEINSKPYQDYIKYDR